MKTFAYTVLTAAMAGGVALGTGGVASAAHCTGETADEKAMPGFSYFGQDGRTDETNTTPGASVCRERTGSPSERAPSQSR